MLNHRLFWDLFARQFDQTFSGRDRSGQLKANIDETLRNEGLSCVTLSLVFVILMRRCDLSLK